MKNERRTESRWEKTARKAEGRRWEAVEKQGGSHDEKDSGEAKSWLVISANALERRSPDRTMTFAEVSACKIMILYSMILPKS